jgi:antitoxin ChpS
MLTANLRTVGGSVILAIPRRLLDLVGLQAGSQVSIDVQDGRLIVAPLRNRYTLSELLAQCDPSLPLSMEEQDWLNAPAVGLEDAGTVSK